MTCDARQSAGPTLVWHPITGARQSTRRARSITAHRSRRIAVLVDHGTEPLRITVVGSGITGLATAHRLIDLSRKADRPVDVTIVDAADRAGGVIATVERDGFTLDLGPDNFVTDKPAAVELVNALGLAEQLQNTNDAHRTAMVVRRGRLVPIPDGFLLMAPMRIMPVLRSPLFSPAGKLRMAAERFIAARADNDDESLASFVTRRLGREALDRLIQPLVGGIYAVDPQTLSLRATLPRFLDMEADHGSLTRAMKKRAKARTAQHTAARYSLFVTLRRDMQTLTDALVQYIGRSNFSLGVPVASITPVEPAESTTNRWRLSLTDGRSLNAHSIIIAAPAHAAASMLTGLDPNLAGRLSEIEYVSSAVIYAAFRRDQIAHPLNAFGFVVPFREQRCIMACSFSSVKYPGRAPDGHVLLRAFVGGALQQHLLDRDDNDLIAAALRDLSELLGIADPPLFTHLQRWPNTMAQYKVGHTDRVAAMDRLLQSHHGLHLAGNAYRGVGIPDCTLAGQRAADTILNRAS